MKCWEPEIKIKKKDVWKFTKKKSERLKGVYIKARRGFMNSLEGICEWKYEIFWKEVSKANGGKFENRSRIKDGNGEL